jgi:hypothetical protein
MKKIVIALSAILAVVSCQSLKEEWQPVFTFGENEPAEFKPATEQDLMAKYGFSEFTTIKALKSMYKTPGVEITGNIWIKGQVISSDRNGNVYRELYIQDETGGIDVKIGKSSLYSDYKLGQWVYVRCASLTLGSYSGMPQLGLDDPTGEYETSYIDLSVLVDQHIFKGAYATPLQPVVVDEAQLQAALSRGYQHELWGKLVTVKGLKYGAPTSYNTDSFKRIFILLYVDQYKDKKDGANRVFCSQKTYGVTTWAMTKNKFLEYLDGGHFDECSTNGGKGMNDVFDPDTGLTVKQTLRNNAVAVTTSQYFHLGQTPVQIRTSGFARFADTEIDPAILGQQPEEDDGALIDVTGILTIYNGAAQFTLVDDPSVSVVKH